MKASDDVLRPAQEAIDALTTEIPNTPSKQPWHLKFVDWVLSRVGLMRRPVYTEAVIGQFAFDHRSQSLADGIGLVIRRKGGPFNVRVRSHRIEQRGNEWTISTEFAEPPFVVAHPLAIGLSSGDAVDAPTFQIDDYSVADCPRA